MTLNQQMRLERQRRAGSLYVHLSCEPTRILRLWMDRAELMCGKACDRIYNLKRSVCG